MLLSSMKTIIQEVTKPLEGGVYCEVALMGGGHGTEKHIEKLAPSGLPASWSPGLLCHDGLKQQSHVTID